MSTADNDKKISRYVTSVINHFNSKDGNDRLVNEISDFLHCIQDTKIIFTTPSCSILGYSQEDLIGKEINSIIFTDDVNILEKYRILGKEFIMYCRYWNKNREVVLLEVRGKTYNDDDSNSSNILALSGRIHSLESTKAIDQIIELQIENMIATKELKQMREIKGIPTNTLSEPSSVYIDHFLDDIGSANDLVNSPVILPPVTETLVKSDEAPKKKKRKSVVANRFCLQCGTNTSPEWRAGPEGPKT